MRSVRTVFHPLGAWLGARSKLQLGVLWVVTTLVFGVALMNKQNILMALRRGDAVTAEFTSRYKLRGIVSKVELAGVRVGTVTGVEELDEGGAAVKMKLDPGTVDILGSTPEAAIRPATFLGGPGLSAYVEITPGGDPGRFRGERISKDHTHTPVEFDRVFEVLGEQARAGLQATVRGLDTALAEGGQEALDGVLTDAPPALRPAAGVLEAATGTEPGDLARLVVDLGKAAAALTATDGELEAVVEDLATVAATLGDRGPDLERAMAEMPATLAAARAGLNALDGSLTRLQATAPGARPSVQRLTEVLTKLPPVLSRARPLLADLRPLAADLKPALDDLAPVAGLLRQLLTDVEGPDGRVLGRIRDSVVPTVLGPYTGTGRDTLLYQELGFFLAGFDGAASYLNSEGNQLNFHIGNSLDSISVGPPVLAPAAASQPMRGMR
jgi:phospholipid/cholesterol/gamma-HCH transport system substrate-binding protein